MYALCPALVRVEQSIPCDPYDLQVWPIRALADGRSELRYQLHTRNIEMHGFLVRLPRRR